MSGGNISLPSSNPSPCPECKKGYLLLFLRPLFKKDSDDFDYYEIYYKCSNEDCGYTVED